MKKIFILAFAAMGLMACETIDEADRISTPIRVEMKKNVLLEDFTGQNCVNCPKAATLLHNLQASSLGRHIIAVSIHGGSMAYSVNKVAMGLATDQGDEYNAHWGVTGWPSGLVDRTDGSKENNGHGTVGKVCDYQTWTNAIANRGILTADADIELTATFDAESRNLTVSGSVVPTEEGKATSISDLAVTVWLTESNITGMQMMPDASRNMQYVHNHVLRDVISAPYGDALRDGSFSYSHTIPTNYGKATAAKYEVKPENMAVVAFVTDKSGEVLQVVDVPVVK